MPSAPRSVVMIERANTSPPRSESAAAASAIPPTTSSIRSGTPITPVSATATLGGSAPIAAAAASRIVSASA